MLFSYLKQTQRFIHDAKQEQINPRDLIDYVNLARREVAMRTQCLRILTPISGAVIGASVVAGGHSYTAPTAIITPPDFPSGNAPFPNGAQATAIATLAGGSISGISITFGGAGYFEPTITINDPTGVGASVTPLMSFINQTTLGQETYPFSAVNLSSFPGVASIYLIKSISLIYSNYRYSLPVYSFSTYQANIRQYPFAYQWVPVLAAQFGQGTNGSFFMYPIPSQPYQVEWDCFCLPSDLNTDQDVEALPQPWTDGVPFLSAYYAFNEMQNLNAARYYKEEFTDWMHRYGAYARPGRRTNPYGRW